MELWLWVAIGILAAVIVLLLIKIYMLQKAAKEIEDGFSEKLMTGTNTLIDISTGNRHMRSLANSLNKELRLLRVERHRFEQGDLELKNAVTNISHDIRTPLTAICGYLDLLEEEEKTEAVSRYLSIIRNRTELLEQLTGELFRYSVILSDRDGLSIEPVVIGSVLEESIVAFYTALTEKGIAPVVQIPEEKVIRNADRSALARIFANLINNAIKYSDGDLDIELKSNGKIIFTNTASGLDEIQVGKLFDRFYTVEAARNSTGLGLSISKILIEQMGGTITAGYENERLSICLTLPDESVTMDKC